jgi:hypothetical protein
MRQAKSSLVIELHVRKYCYGSPYHVLEENLVKSRLIGLVGLVVSLKND